MNKKIFVGYINTPRKIITKTVDDILGLDLLHKNYIILFKMYSILFINDQYSIHKDIIIVLVDIDSNINCTQ